MTFSLKNSRFALQKNPIMKKVLAIRHENKYEAEKRVPLIPKHLKKLIDKGYEVLVEESAKRTFTHDEYKAVGANVQTDISSADIIIGVKEIPIPNLQANKTYMYFSHVIKGQAYNMPMLRKLKELKCNLIDYEKVTDEFGKRIIFFGRYAGLAGMINTLWSLGQRYKSLGIDTPFAQLKQTQHYFSLDEVKAAISKVGFEIIEKGLPKEILPLTFGMTGYGNVSNGAQEILNLLPVKEISPEELLNLKNDPSNGHVVYKTVFKEQDMVAKKGSDEEFELHDYYVNPQNYESVFDQYTPKMSVLVHGSYWDEKYPRIITKDYVKKIYEAENPKLMVVGDISCDPDGGVEFTHKGTEIADPVFVYDPETDKPTMGFDGHGILVMSVDILPSELPRDASTGFSEALSPYIEAIINADFDKSTEETGLPAAIRRALILHKGEFTPEFEYISEYLNQ